MPRTRVGPQPREDAAFGTTRAGEALAAVVIVAAITVAASGIFFRSPLVLTLSPIAGIAAALACRRTLDAATAAALGIAAGALAVSLVPRLPLGAAVGWAPGAVIAMVAAAAIAAGCAWLRARGGRVPQLLALVGVLAIIASGWFVTLPAVTGAGADGASVAEKLTVAAPMGPQVFDEEIYRNFVIRMNGGVPYYRAAGSVLSEANTARPGTTHDVDLSSPPSFRLPTMYWVLSKLPANGVALVMATLLVGAIASVSAYWVARAYVSSAFALVGTAAVASMYSGLSEGPQLLHTEVWAGAFALVSIALFVWSRRADRGTLLLWASAGAALLAAVTRELAVAYLVLGLGATLALPRGRKPREWLGWVVGLALFAGAYALHTRAVAAVYPTLAATVSTGRAHWFDASAIGGVAVANRLGELAFLQAVPVYTLIASGVIGALVAPKNLSSRIFLAGAIVGGTIVVTFFHPSGELLNGLPAAYWGQLVMPSVFAAVPLAATLVPGWRERGEAVA